MIIAVDFDGTIIENTKYPDTHYILKPNAKEVLYRLSCNHKIVLCTARYGWYFISAVIFILKNKLPIKIKKGKPVADLYIDDNNIGSYTIDWLQIEKDINKIHKSKEEN